MSEAGPPGGREAKRFLLPRRRPGWRGSPRSCCAGSTGSRRRAPASSVVRAASARAARKGEARRRRRRRLVGHPVGPDPDGESVETRLARAARSTANPSASLTSSPKRRPWQAEPRQSSRTRACRPPSRPQVDDQPTAAVASRGLWSRSTVAMAAPTAALRARSPRPAGRGKPPTAPCADECQAGARTSGTRSARMRPGRTTLMA
jgi:hypothetical protein